MTPYEIMLSESQERMLLVLRRGAEAKARAIFAKWDLDCVTVGRVIEGGEMVLRLPARRWRGCRSRRSSEASPVYERPWREQAPAAAGHRARRAAAARPPGRAASGCSAAPTSPAKRWIFEQYDHMVMGDTVQGPGGDAAVIRIHGSRSGDRADHRLHAALLRRRPAPRRQAGGRRGVAQPVRGRRAAARAHRLPELRQPREPRRSWASSSAASRACARPAGRSTSRSSRATSRSTTRPTASRSGRRRRSAASG